MRKPYQYDPSEQQYVLLQSLPFVLHCLALAEGHHSLEE
jgi:hypothetical protein